MVATSLFFLTTILLATRAFPAAAPAARLAAAVLTALGVPVLAVVAAARVGIDANMIVLAVAHAGLWVFALRSRGSSAEDRSAHSVGPLFALAASVATLSALLGVDPSEVVIVDGWAHLAWGRSLVESIGEYAPAFPALLGVLSWDEPLFGAFRCAPLVLHFALAAQFLALGSGSGSRAIAALPALAYLVVPVAGSRFEIPGPELMSAVFLVGLWSFVGHGALSLRKRAAVVALLCLAIVVSHVSILQIALFTGLGVAVLFGGAGRSWSERVVILAAMLGGIVVAALLSPSFVSLVTAPDSVALVALQAGSVTPISPKEFVAALGVALGGLAAVAVLVLIVRRSHFDAMAIANVVGLGVAFVLLLAPLVLEPLGIVVPLQLFTDRLLMAAALPVAMGVAFVLGRARLRLAGRDVTLVAALLCVTAGQLTRPVDALALALAALLAVVTILIVRRFPTRAWILVALVGIGLGMGVRAWVWTPLVPDHVAWLRAAEKDAVLLTNWPITNELDALLDLEIVDGLAGRDANLALHRKTFTTELRDRLAWCDGSPDVVELERYLRASDVREAYLLVDRRFTNAWQTYRKMYDDRDPAADEDAAALLSAVPCEEDDASRLQTLRAALDAWPLAEKVFESEDAVIHRVVLSDDLPHAPHERGR